MSRATSSGCARPGRLEAAVRVRAAQPVITDLELIVDGRVVAARRRGETGVDPDARAPRDASRSRPAPGSPPGHGARTSSSRPSTTSMAAHTSPVYVEVDGRPFVPKAEAGVVVERIIEGARTWIDELARGRRAGRARPDGRLPRRQPGDAPGAADAAALTRVRPAARPGSAIGRPVPIVRDPSVGRVVELDDRLRVAGQEVEVVGVRAGRRRHRVIALVDEHEVAIGGRDRDVEVGVAGVQPLDGEPVDRGRAGSSTTPRGRSSRSGRRDGAAGSSTSCRLGSGSRRR